MAPATRTIASTNHNEEGDVGARLRSGSIFGSRDDVKGWIFRYNSLDLMREAVRWNVYKNGILQRFGIVFDDPVSKLRKIKYQSNAKDYQDAFDTLLSRVDVSEEHAVSFYLGEATLETIKKKNKTVGNSQQGWFGGGGNSYESNVNPYLLPLPSSNPYWRNKPNTPVANPIRKQMTQKEYRENGQLYSIVLLADEELEGEEEYIEEESLMSEEVP
ncbi:hypothetical protein Tco_1522337 [Tanacetum coccineum]